MPPTILMHPLIQHKLTILRDIDTGVKIFREVVGEIAMLMCYEAMRNLPLEEVQVTTPVAKATSKALSGKKLALVPILRAGLGMVDGILTLVPSAKVAHIGLYRDPETLQPVEYYCKMPHDISERDCFILDPMLATGGTAAAAAQYLKDAGARSLKLLTILSAPPGVEKMQLEHPDVEIITCAIDSHLNDHGYIVPGLGDAGDRIFGTK
ncbi:MAG: uracil phosphoribosyltransferase [Oscillospiraceae bacterium]|nr:uracil phosphoribosyltransferase [Oscillospiraceae bacterium]